MKYEVLISSIDHSGRGISRIDNKIVFVPKTLIGDRCIVKITKTKKNYFEAELVELLEKGPKRIKAVCPYFDICGGCDLLHMSYKDQLRYKEEKVKNIISRYTSLDKKIVKKIIPCDSKYFYRNKVNFKVRKKVGFYQKKSYDIVEVKRCLIADSNINDILNLIRNNINLDFVKEITIRSSLKNDDDMVIFHTTKKINVDALKGVVSSIVFYDGKKYEVEYGKPYISDKIGKYEFIISPDSFFQVNTRQAENLYDQVLEYADLKKTDTVLDLYSGTGTIGIYLSSKVSKVISIEINKDANKDAIKNKRLNNVDNIEFMCGDASVLIDQVKDKIDVLIVDPPRSGLNDECINNIIKTKADRVVYVSCDPITLARDLEKLKSKYDTLEITPVDMFCNTYHVECVTILHRKKIEK